MRRQRHLFNESHGDSIGVLGRKKQVHEGSCTLRVPERHCKTKQTKQSKQRKP